jgi:hypothetical protein
MDPLGFVFENFVRGRRRPRPGRQTPIDASGELPDGRKVQWPSPVEGHLLKEKKDLVARNLAERVLTGMPWDGVGIL